MLKHFGIGQGVATKKIGKMLDDTYYDDFFNVLHDRMFKNKLSPKDYKEIIESIDNKEEFFNDLLELI